METYFPPKDWALILGASSGFGAATARELSRRGMNIFGVHLDRRGTIPLAEQVQKDVESTGRRCVLFNVNAADELKRKEVLDAIEPILKEGGTLRILLHSLAFGTLKAYYDDDPEMMVRKPQMDMTVDVMANSLVYWAQDLASRKLLKSGSRIFAMTSAGGERAWRTYGPVSAAKAALEAHIRQLALELSPLGVTCNSLLAGVTNTPALRKIPGSELMLEGAGRRNPGRRLTTPEDVAQAIACLSLPGTQWVTGNVIHVDGGENIVD